MANPRQLIGGHRGEWVAVEGGKVVAASSDVLTVTEAAATASGHPFIALVGSEHSVVFRVRKAVFAYMSRVRVLKPSDDINSFREFWPYYVGEHRRRSTRAWHFFGTTLALSLLATAIALRWWLALLAVPICGYAFAWLSHLCFERNRPATFRYPLWSLAADFKMWALIVTGRMAAEVRSVLGEDGDRTG